MRRSDRQITDPDQIEAILQKAVCCRLGLVDDGRAYIVPMNFGFVKENDKQFLYFHSTPKGKKIDLIEQTGKASFEADLQCDIVENAQACAFSCYYQSVIGFGTITIVQEEREKLHALRCVMEHYTGKADWEISLKALAEVVCIRLEIEEMTAKAHRLPSE